MWIGCSSLSSARCHRPGSCVTAHTCMFRGFVTVQSLLCRHGTSVYDISITETTVTSAVSSITALVPAESDGRRRCRWRCFDRHEWCCQCRCLSLASKPHQRSVESQHRALCLPTSSSQVSSRSHTMSWLCMLCRTNSMLPTQFQRGFSRMFE